MKEIKIIFFFSKISDKKKETLIAWKKKDSVERNASSVENKDGVAIHSRDVN